MRRLKTFNELWDYSSVDEKVEAAHKVCYVRCKILEESLYGYEDQKRMREWESLNNYAQTMMLWLIVMAGGR